MQLVFSQFLVLHSDLTSFCVSMNICRLLLSFLSRLKTALFLFATKNEFTLQLGTVTSGSGDFCVGGTQPLHYVVHRGEGGRYTFFKNICYYSKIHDIIYYYIYTKCLLHVLQLKIVHFICSGWG